MSYDPLTGDYQPAAGAGGSFSSPGPSSPSIPSSSTSASPSSFQPSRGHPHTITQHQVEPTLPNLSPLPVRSPLPGQSPSHFRPQPLPPPPSTSAWTSPPRQQPPLTPRSPQAYSSPIRDRMDRDDDLGGSGSASGSTRPNSSVNGGGERQNGNSQTPVEGFVRIKIMGIEKNRRDVYFKFNAESNMPTFRNSTYRSISRSYTEFQKFAEAIAANNPQSIVPALPLVQTSALNDAEDDRLVKASYQKWVARITLDQAIVRDEELRGFVESEFGYTPSTRSRRRVPSTFHFPRGSRLPGEVDDSLTLAKSAMSRLELQFLEGAKAVEKVSKARRAVAVAYLDVGDHLNTFATTEVYQPLAMGVRKLGRTLKVEADLLANQASSEMVTLGDAFTYQITNARSAKETLVSRDVIVEEHRAAVKATIAKRRNIERLKGGSNLKSDKVDEALEELDDAKRHETLLTTRLSSISSHLEPSLRNHSLHAHQDLLTALLDHARSQLMHEKLWLKELELVRPELHAIKNPEPGVIYHSTTSTGGAGGKNGVETPPRTSSVGAGTSANGLGVGVSPQTSPTRTIHPGELRDPGSSPQLQQGQQQAQARSAIGRGGPNFADLPLGRETMSGLEVRKRSIHSMAKSVVVADDRRQRVDAKMAASMLANGGF